MASKLRMDLNLDTTGYQTGVRDAVKSTKTLESSTEEYLKSFGSLRKQMTSAKKEAQNLAAQFAALSQAEKNSEIGKELSENLQIAIEKAAELQDVMADTNDAIKNAASDTAGLDALKEVFDISKEATTAYIGVLGRLTDNEKELKNVVSSLAAVQGTFNTVIKATNALQKNSATMIALQRSGVLSLAQAEKISTAATKASTVAIKGLGVAMKALPYVAVAAGILAVGKAFVGWASGANKAIQPVANINKELKGTEKILSDVASAYNGNYASTLGKTMGLYRQLQSSYKQMSSTHEKTKWIQENSDKLKELGISTKDVNEVDRILIRQSEQVIESFKLRAEAAAEAARLQSLYTQRIEAEEKARANASKNNFKKDQEIHGDDVSRYGLEEGKDYYTSKYKSGMWLTDEGAMKAQQKAAEKNVETYTKGIDAAIEESVNRLANATTKYNDILKGLGVIDTSSNSGTNKITKEQITHLEELTNKAKDVQKQLENLDKTSPTFEIDKTKLQADLKAALQEVKDYRIAIGLDLPKSKLQELKDELKTAEAELPFAVSEEDVQKAWVKINNLKDQIESEEIRLGIKVEPVSDGKDVKKVQDILQETFNKITPPKFDFSFIPDDFKFDGTNIADIENKYDALIEARQQLTDIMNTSTDDQAIHDAQIGLEAIGDEIDSLEPKLETLNNINEKFKQFKEISDAAGKAGNYLNQLGSAFTQLGEATDSAGVKAVGIILETLANLALSFSQAMIQAASMGPWAWIAFGIAGVAQLAAMISQIKGMVSGGFAEGGVVPGSSFSGDKLLARVNSGERILTAKQNENLEKIANSQYQPYRDVGPTTLSFKLKGEDIYGSMTNYKNIHRIS